MIDNASVSRATNDTEFGELAVDDETYLEFQEGDDE